MVQGVVLVDVATQADLEAAVPSGGTSGQLLTPCGWQDKPVLDVRDFASPQSAIDAAEAAGGGTVLLSAGTHIVAAPLDLKPGVRVLGHGPEATTVQVQGGGDAFSVFRQTSANAGNAHLEGVTLDGNKANTTNPGPTVVLDLISNVSSPGNVFRDIRIVNGHREGVRVSGNISATTFAEALDYEILFEDVSVDNCDSIGVDVARVHGVRFRGGTVSGSTLDGMRVIGPAYDISVDGVTFEGNGDHGIVGLYLRDFVVTRCLSRNNGKFGIAFGGGNGSFPVNHRNVASANTAYGNGDGGITLDPTVSGQSGVAQPIYTTVVGNTLEGAGTGIHGVYVNNAKHVSVVGNVCHGFGSAGVAANGEDVVVAGNSLSGNGSYGISVHAGAVRTRVGANALDGNALGPTNDVGTDTFGLGMHDRPTVPAAGTVTADDIRQALIDLGLVA